MSKPLEVIVSDGQGRNKNALEKAAKLLSEVPNGYEAAVSRSMNRDALLRSQRSGRSTRSRLQRFAVTSPSIRRRAQTLKRWSRVRGLASRW